jgi:uncharacterized protein (TIGR02588 family)
MATGDGGRDRDAASRWEDAVAALGAVLVAGTLGYMGWHVATSEATPPALSLEVASVEPQGDRYLVTFRARNAGGSTAAQVHVAGELGRGGEVVEEGEATVDYVPSSSERRGGLVFTRDPRRHELTLRVKGWTEP